MQLARFLNNTFKNDGFILVDADSKKYIIGSPKKKVPITLNPVTAIRKAWKVDKPIRFGNVENTRIEDMKSNAIRPKNGPAVIEISNIGPISEGK